MPRPLRERAADFDDLHRRALPQRLATPLGRAAARDVRGVTPLAFRLPDGRSYRFVPDGDTIRIESGHAGATVVDLGEDAWRDLVGEWSTVAGLHYEGRAVVSGDRALFERWEPALRALFSGRPIFDPTAAPSATPDRVFTLDDPPSALRDFIHATGYLHVRGVFTAGEVARLSDLMARRAALARPGDGTSWWARLADGSSALCRLIYLGLVEPDVAALSDDPRLCVLAGLAGEPLRAALDRSDGHSLVMKVPGAVEGLADLPWHRDCGLGGHPVKCPALNVGIQLDAATEETGRLSFIPGSWRASCHRHDLARAPVVAVDTEPGDCTVHFGDTLHAAPPPTGAGPGRRALYVSYMPERAHAYVPAGKSYNDVIRARVGS